jgi:threonine dehydrogenase-like Zn-dependent dehydrogenase
MKAVTWHGRRDVRVGEVPDPAIEEPTDAIVRVTSSGICGSDLHLYEVLGPFMGEGDVLGHEPMGIVEEVGGEVNGLKPGDRVVVPFNISCGHCYMCERELYAQCETTQNRDQGTGASLFGYTKLYGQVPGGQAEFLRVPQAQFGPIKVPVGPPDERFVYSPTSCRRHGRRSSSPRSLTGGPLRCSGWARSARWRQGSQPIGAIA